MMMLAYFKTIMIQRTIEQKDLIAIIMDSKSTHVSIDEQFGAFETILQQFYNVF